MTAWSQDYTPLGNIPLSALLAALPVATLLGLLAFWHVRAHFAALAGLLVAEAIASASAINSFNPGQYALCPPPE